MSDLDVKAMQNAGNAQIEVECYSQGRGTCRHKDPDVYISRPAGIVSTQEVNSRDLASFRGSEQLRKSGSR